MPVEATFAQLVHLLSLRMPIDVNFEKNQYAFLLAWLCIYLLQK